MSAGQPFEHGKPRLLKIRGRWFVRIPAVGFVAQGETWQRAWFNFEFHLDAPLFYRLGRAAW